MPPTNKYQPQNRARRSSNLQLQSSFPAPDTLLPILCTIGRPCCLSLFSTHRRALLQHTLALLAYHGHAPLIRVYAHIANGARPSSSQLQIRRSSNPPNTSRHASAASSPSPDHGVRSAPTAGGPRHVPPLVRSRPARLHDGADTRREALAAVHRPRHLAPVVDVDAGLGPALHSPAAGQQLVAAAARPVRPGVHRVVEPGGGPCWKCGQQYSPPQVRVRAIGVSKLFDAAWHGVGTFWFVESRRGGCSRP